MNRRQAIQATALSTSALLLHLDSKGQDQQTPPSTLQGTFKHSVSRWCFNNIPFEAFCKEVAAIGMHSIELTGPEEWKIMDQYGLTCAMGWDTYPEGVNLDNFMANPDNHDKLEEYYKNLIPKAAKAGVKNLICLSGQRQGRTDYENLINCKKGINRFISIAEEYDVTISIENLNSKLNHPDHQFDRMEWGITLCEMIDSDHFKILYDIYHAQIMEGDVVATIRKYSDYISHYHTAGVPGRHEIDHTQELNYRFIMEAIRETGYTGFIGQEFIPTSKEPKEQIRVLKEAMLLCNV